MRGRLFKLVVLILLASTLTSASLPAATDAPPPESRTPPGVQAAQTISLITGVAISPLLGVSAVGAWTYFRAPEEERAELPWFAQPWFWLGGLLLVAMTVAKDTLGPAVPTLLKKPFDVAEAVENKLSGLVATGAFVPLVVDVFQPDAGATAAVYGPVFAAVEASDVLNALLVPFAMIAFVMVWLVSHAIHMLILLSPFATVDAALKLFRTFILSTVCVTAFVNPYVGAVWAALLIVICYFLAGWAFRLTVFGSLFIGDYVTFKRRRFFPDEGGNWMFLAREIDGVPVRTFGRLTRHEEGALIFAYRPWLVLPARTLTLPKGSYAVGRALLLPEIRLVEGEAAWTVLLLPPRCLSHEERLARIYGMEVMDVGMVKGAKAFWQNLRRLCGGPTTALPASA
jgi:hypothetical protein